MKVGTVVDLRTYRDYCPRFNEALGRPCEAVELHLISSDLASPERFLEGVEGCAEFLREAGVGALGHHYLDGVLNRLMAFKIYGAHPVYKDLCQGTNPAKEEESLELLLEGSVRASRRFGRKVKAIVHEGLFFNSQQLDALGRERLLEVRQLFLEGISRAHEQCFARFRDRVDIYLENSPPYAAPGSATQHFIDQVPTDTIGRLQGPDRFVLDVSHWFMCCEYLRRGARGIWGLDVLGLHEQFGGQSVAGYEMVRACAREIGWVHLSDCTGIHHEHEGHALFQRDSVVDWERLVPILKSLDAPLVLEIMGSERDFSRVERSLLSLREHWGMRS
ncbi:MAG: hypothetical protein JXB05_12185 [Myxococcaceae bacterium]|nr:hypothetical protein [Myxococcaceae bacterium]